MTNPNKIEVTNDYDALVLALKLAIIAPNDDAAKECQKIAVDIAANLNKFLVSRAKKEALEIAKGEV
mgnify:FL=1